MKINKIKISLISLGCPKNTVDSEKMLNSFNFKHFTIVSDPYKSDAVIINTCGFIKPAILETENTIN